MEIKKIISNFQNKNNVSSDGINCKTLRNIRDHVSVYLCNLINLSFSKATVPRKLKCVRIVPEFKKGDRKSRVNYRPIAVPPAISNLLETNMRDRIVPFLEKTNFFLNFNMAFVPTLLPKSPLWMLLQIHKRIWIQISSLSGYS